MIFRGYNPNRVPTGLWKTTVPLFSTHITPLAGLLLRGIEPIDPAWKGGTFSESENLTFSQWKVEY